MPELRKDPITDRWVIISTDRARRPSDFFRGTTPARPSGRFCPFCPGNENKTPPEVLAYRHGSGPNQPGWSLRVFPNKFPVLGIEGDLDREGDGMFDKMQGIGAHEVIVETPEHALSMTELSEKSIEQVLCAFRDRIYDLRNDRRLRYVLLFKNQGEAAGATLEAYPFTTHRSARGSEARAGRSGGRKELLRFQGTVHILRPDPPGGEIGRTGGSRDGSFHCARALRGEVSRSRPGSCRSSTILITERRDSQQFENLAWVLKSTLRKLENVLEMPPYNFLIHTAPLQEAVNPYYHWHIEVIPKLTRVAGFEWGTGFYINPTPPEESARFLREAGLG